MTDRPTELLSISRVSALRRDKKWDLYRNTTDDTHYIEYIECRNVAAKVLRKEKKTFERKLAADVKINAKSFYVPSQTKSRDRVGLLKDSLSNIIEDDKCMSELVKSFFASVFTHENVGSIPEVNQVFNGDSSQSLSEIKKLHVMIYSIKLLH